MKERDFRLNLSFLANLISSGRSLLSAISIQIMISLTAGEIAIALSSLIYLGMIYKSPPSLPS